MQKYYALTDALNAIGKMGGAAIGGAIGGDVLGGAPNVGEYKESRGYLDAFERAKQANDRLRALDEKEFQLAYNKAQRDEERAYSDAARAEDRKYRKDLMLLEHELRKAEKADDRAWEERVKKEILELTHAHEEKMKNMSMDIVKLQMGDKEKEQKEDSIPFTFSNMTKTDIPKNLYTEMLKLALSQGKIDEDYVDEDNVEIVLRKHPEFVNKFLNIYGLGTQPEETQVVATEETVEEPAPKQKASFFNKTTTGGLGGGYNYAYDPNFKPKKESSSNETSAGEDSVDANKKWAHKKRNNNGR